MMKNLTNFTLDNPNYLVKQLFPEDVAVLQKLYEQCNDFALLTDGEVFSSTAASEEFNTVPEGKTAEDICVFGLFNLQNIFIGAIVAVRHYPDKQTWWIGTMMLAPEHRGKGLGTDFYRAFECWLLRQGIQQISLCAIAVNQKGWQFWQKMGFKIIRKIPAKQYGIKTHQVYVLSRNAIAKPK